MSEISFTAQILGKVGEWDPSNGMPEGYRPLVMLVPSRGRPQNVVHLMDAWRNTASGDARLVVAVDDDDPAIDDYKRVAQNAATAAWYDERRPEHQRLGMNFAEFVFGPRLRLGGTLNKLAGEIAPTCFAVGFLGDDHRPRSQGWDKRFMDELFGLGTGLVYGNDLYQGANLPTAVAMTSDVVTTLGYMVPPGLTHMYIDDAWKAIGQAIYRLSYLDDVIIEHLHPLANKAPWDAGYEEVNAGSMYERDRAAFMRWQATSMATDIERLRAVAE